jgi:hypothetical protein
MQLQFNIIPFLAPDNQVSFSFFKQKKDESFRPLRKSEYPRELWDSNELELQNIQNLYCNFSDKEENHDFSCNVDLNNSTPRCRTNPFVWYCISGSTQIQFESS